MGRLKELRKYVDNELNQMEDVDKRTSAIVHLYGVSLAATIEITTKRHTFHLLMTSRNTYVFLMKGMA